MSSIRNDINDIKNAVSEGANELYTYIKDAVPEGVEMVMPGDNVTFTVELIAPVAIEKGLKFTVREGGRTVGAGVVSEIDD